MSYDAHHLPSILYIVIMAQFKWIYGGTNVEIAGEFTNWQPYEKQL